MGQCPKASLVTRADESHSYSLSNSPRFDVTVKEMDRWANNLLPSRQFGYVVLTTSAGIMDHEEARRKHTGGKILGYFY
jgi:small subunit ribosomal protein S15Ae